MSGLRGGRGRGGLGWRGAWFWLFGLWLSSRLRLKWCLAVDGAACVVVGMKWALWLGEGELLRADGGRAFVSALAPLLFHGGILRQLPDGWTTACMKGRHGVCSHTLTVFGPWLP